MQKPEWKTLLRGMLTAVVLGCLTVRVIRIVVHWQSVAQFYMFGRAGGSLWRLVGWALFLGPYLTALAAGAGLWLRRDRAGDVSFAALCAGGFFVLYEGLTLFARAVNGNGGYVGAEPLLSLAVCVVAGAGIFLSARERR